MAPWPELENAQPNSDKYIEGVAGQQSTTPAKGKETGKSTCHPSSPGLAPWEDTRRPRLGVSFLIVFPACLGR